MKKVNKITRSNLLETLKDNREKHKAIFEEADGNYRQFVVDALRERANKIKAGGRIDYSFHLPAPVSHLEDYDEAIQMLEWEIEDYIELDVEDFRNFVLDKWNWQQQFVGTTSLYNSRA